jgi:hypothetical protein
MKIGARIGDDDFGVTTAQVMQKNLRDEANIDRIFSHQGTPRFCKSRIAGSTRDSRLVK